MIKLVYFASIRERLTIDGEQLEYDSSVSNVKDLLAQLVGRGSPWSEVLTEGQLLVAINQEMCQLVAEINDGDEVALFPPVTGG